MKHISREFLISSFNPIHEPVATVDDGEMFTVDTLDCYGGRITSEHTKRRQTKILHINESTGPIYIKNAERGDTLMVEVVDIKLASSGLMVTMPDMGVLGDMIFDDTTKIIPVSNGVAHFSDTIKLPLTPMIGVLGVAPIKGDIETTLPGDHGGNMDVKLISKGAKVYFPVSTDGALLACGDLHACMGDGELSGTGIEIGGTVTLRVEVIKGRQLMRPVVETEDRILTIASDVQLQSAIKTASHDMVSLLMRCNDISFTDAYCLLGAACDVEICQIVNDIATVRIGANKPLLTIEGIY